MSTWLDQYNPTYTARVKLACMLYQLGTSLETSDSVFGNTVAGVCAQKPLNYKRYAVTVTDQRRLTNHDSHNGLGLNLYGSDTQPHWCIQRRCG